VNEVIEKGFDGQHFITGMGEHLRNLLMSVDADTVKLIETSDAVRAKYVSQARSVSLQLLIDALEVINKTDITYRTSNNKRLSLELPLIHICRLSGQMSMPVITTTPAIQHSASQGQTNQVVDIKSVVETPDIVAAAETVKAPEVEIKPAVTPITVPEPVSAPEAPPVAGEQIPDVKAVETISNQDSPKKQEQVTPPEHDVPVQSHHVSSFSIKSVLKADQLARSVEAAPELNRNENFTFEQLESALLNYAENKKEESALYYSALTSYKPVLQPDNVLVITVGNTVLEKDFNDRRNVLLEFLRNEMKNDSITLQVTVTEQPSETKKYLNDREKLDAMSAQNPNLSKLRDQLNLELDLQ
jgi:DNA polymerase-3 subunit gamma/tau